MVWSDVFDESFAEPIWHTGSRHAHDGPMLSDDDITHYHRIVVALAETIRLMREIDDVIAEHGGWPTASSSGTPTASEVIYLHSEKDLQSVNAADEPTEYGSEAPPENV